MVYPSIWSGFFNYNFLLKRLTFINRKQLQLSFWFNTSLKFFSVFNENWVNTLLISNF